MKSQNNIFSKLLILPAIIFMLCGMVQAQALETQTQQLGTPKVKSFEGSVFYTIRLSGKNAVPIMENKPANILALHIKGDNFIVNLSGGRIARTFLFIGDSNHTYIVDAARARYFKRTYFLGTKDVRPTAKPTGETVQIKGIQCQEYKMVNAAKEETIFFYVTDNYRVDPALFEGKEKAKADFLVKGLDGRIPLRKIIKGKGITTELDLRSITPKVLAPENFLIPSSFKLKLRDPRK